jgi:hypothetical protein
MDEPYTSRLVPRIMLSYDDKRNTISWALMIWSVTAIGFSVHMPVLTNLVGSSSVALAWTAVHLVRRM